jgi:LytS/YehU family sensor histidine kinase
VKWWEPILWEGSSCLVATTWLLLQRRVARRWNEYLEQPSKWFGKHLVWLPVIAVTFIAAIYAIRHGVYALTGETYEHASWPYTFLYESVKLTLFTALWLAIIFGLASFSMWREQRERLLELQRHLAESQLNQLKAQLQPHFLFNALNTISALMQSDVERADRLLARLADLLRASLAVGTRQQTSLREEWKLLELYASIMQERFAGRVTIDWQASDEALDATIPAMLLQPLLENAYKHGVERSSQPVAIRVEARREGEELLVRINNTGSRGAGESGGIGVRNCRDRLALVYGDRASLALTSDADGVTAAVRLPYQRS